MQLKTRGTQLGPLPCVVISAPAILLRLIATAKVTAIALAVRLTTPPRTTRPRPRSDPPRDGAWPEVIISISDSDGWRTSSGSDSDSAPEPYPSSTAAPTPRALTPATTTTTKRRAGASTPSAHSPPTPSLSLKTMKQTIKDAGLGTVDLVERKDVEERYAQAKARLAEAERLKRRSRDDDGAPAPKAPRVRRRGRRGRAGRARDGWHQNATRRDDGAAHGRARRPQRHGGVPFLSAFDVCDEEGRGADLRRHHSACNRRRPTR